MTLEPESRPLLKQKQDTSIITLVAEEQVMIKELSWDAKKIWDQLSQKLNLITPVKSTIQVRTKEEDSSEQPLTDWLNNSGLLNQLDIDIPEE